MVVATYCNVWTWRRSDIARGSDATEAYITPLILHSRRWRWPVCHCLLTLWAVPRWFTQRPCNGCCASARAYSPANGSYLPPHSWKHHLIAILHLHKLEDNFEVSIPSLPSPWDRAPRTACTSRTLVLSLVKLSNTGTEILSQVVSSSDHNMLNTTLSPWIHNNNWAETHWDGSHRDIQAVWQGHWISQDLEPKKKLRDSIFTANGQLWQTSRSLIRLMFVKDRVRDLDIFYHWANVFVSKLPASGETFDVCDLFYGMTLHVTTDSILIRV